MNDQTQDTPIQEQVQEKIVEKEANKNEKIVGKEEEIKEDSNWKAFREARKKDRAEKEAALKLAQEKEKESAALKAAMEAAFAKMPPAPLQREYEPYYNQQPNEEEIIDKKIKAALDQREAQYRQEQQEREQREAPQRIVQTYPDFNQVVNQDNCDYIDYHFPELAAPFAHMPDGFAKWDAMYKLIKKFVPNASEAKRDAARAENNFNKPRSMSATGMSQSKDQVVTQLSEERKAQNWERMKNLLKSAS